VGTAGAWDERTRAWNGGVFDPAVRPRPDAATIHLYPGLPNVNLSLPANFPALLAPLFTYLAGFQHFTDASIPPPLPLWVTEWGTWGCPAVQGTWLQGLWHAAFTLLLPFTLPRVEVLLPYCSVCGDPAMPSFTTPAYGPVVPPNATPTAGDWLRTPSGHALALTFFGFAAAAPAGGQWVAVSFGVKNPPLDPAVPGSVALVGGLALDAGGRPAALVAANLGAAPAPLDLRGVPFSCAPPAQLCAVVYHAKPGDEAQKGLRVEQLVRVAAAVGAEGLALLPPYALGAAFCTVSPTCKEV
jgi:hypothetical protein